MGLVATGWAEQVSRCVQHSLTGALAELGSRWQLSHSEASLATGLAGLLPSPALVPS